MNIQIGTTVSWKTHGITSHIRRGTVINVVPAGVQPNLVQYARTHNFKSMSLSNKSRTYLSYLISVPSHSSKARPYLYWPRVVSLGNIVAIGTNEPKESQAHGQV